MTTTSFTVTNGYPEAHICVKKGRLPKYNNKNVFLQDKQEFEIELFNPSTTVKLARILMNGKAISTSGIVLKPGQRVYLERFIDTPEKFKFETYKVDNTPAAQQAIQLNGDVEVQFFDEVIPYNPPSDWLFQCNTTGGYSYPRHTLTASNSGSGSYSCSTGNLRSKGLFDDGAGATLDCMDFMKQEKETGRVEKGSKSDQNFTNYYGKFQSYYSTVVKIKILPVNEKPVEISQLATYCTQCGTKNRKGNYKFCPTCGTKF